MLAIPGETSALNACEEHEKDSAGESRRALPFILLLLLLLLLLVILLLLAWLVFFFFFFSSSLEPSLLFVFFCFSFVGLGH